MLAKLNNISPKMEAIFYGYLFFYHRFRCEYLYLIVSIAIMLIPANNSNAQVESLNHMKSVQNEIDSLAYTILIHQKGEDWYRDSRNKIDLVITFYFQDINTWNDYVYDVINNGNIDNTQLDLFITEFVNQYEVRDLFIERIELEKKRYFGGHGSPAFSFRIRKLAM